MAGPNNITPPFDFGQLLEGEALTFPKGVRADAEAGFGLGAPILAANLEFGQSPKSFGSNHDSGANAQLQALADFAALAHFIGGIDRESDLAEETPGLNALLDTHRDALKGTVDENALTLFEMEIRQAGAEGREIGATLKSAAIANGISLEDLDLQNARTLAEEEVRRLEAMAANTNQLSGDLSSPLRWARPPGPPVATLDKDKTNEMLTGVDQVFDAGASAGYPDISARQRLLVKAVFTEETTRASGLHPDYLLFTGYSKLANYGGAAIATGSEAFKDAYDAYKEAGGEWTWEQWQDTAKGKANAVWDALEETIGAEDAERFKQASLMVNQDKVERIAHYAGMAIEGGNQHSQRDHTLISKATLQLIFDADPTLYAEIAGDKPPSEAKVKYGEISDRINRDTARYTGPLTLTDLGPSPKEGGVPINLNMVRKGQGPIASIPENGYPINAAAAITLGAVERYDGQPAIPVQEVNTPPEGDHGLGSTRPKARPDDLTRQP